MSGFKDAWAPKRCFAFCQQLNPREDGGEGKREGGIGLEGGGVHLAEVGGCVMGGGESFDCLEVEAQTDNQRQSLAFSQRSGGWVVRIEMEAQVRFEV